MLKWLARSSHRNPWLWLFGWLLLIAAALPLAGELHSVLRSGGFSNPHGEAARYEQLLQEGFGTGGPALLVVYRKGADPGITRLQQALEDLPELKSVAPLPGAGEGVYRLAFAASENEVENLVPALERRLGDAARITGAPALDRALNVASKRSAQQAEMIAFPVMVALLFGIFRSARLTLLPLALAGVVILLGSGLGTAIGRAFPLSILYENILSMLALALAVDYSLFITSRFREELARGRTRGEALEAALATAGHSVWVSGLAVAVALAALFIPRIMVFSSIALGGIAATLLAVLAALTLLPALLVLFAPGLPERKPRQADTGSQWLTWVTRRPGVVTTGVILLLLAATLPLRQLSLHVPVASARSLPKDDPARLGLEDLTRRQSPGRLFPIEGIVVGKDADAVYESTRRIAEGLKRDPNLIALYTPSGSESGPLVRTHGGRTYARWIAVPKTDPNHPATRDWVTRARAAAHQAATPGLAVAVGGTTARGLDFDRALLAAVPWILGWVLSATLALLFLAFRSLWVSLLALGFNLLVTASSLGLLILAKSLLGGGSLNSVTPILVFAVMFGLSMDYFVIMVSRVREAVLEGHSPERAIVLGLGRAAPLVNAAALIMLAVFLAFGTAWVDVVQELGVGLALAIALDAFVVRQTLLPATFLLLGKRLWHQRKELVHAV